MDDCRDYKNGRCEVRMGKAPRHRYRDRVHREGGACEALVEARKADKRRVIGFTGHKDPALHLRTLEVGGQREFAFGVVQWSLSLLDAHHRSFARQVLPVFMERDVGVLGMKSTPAGHLRATGLGTPAECPHHTLDPPAAVVITGMDSLALLNQAPSAARTFAPLCAGRREELLARTATTGARGEFEPFKPTARRDATAADPPLLGDEPEPAPQGPPRARPKGATPCT